MSFSSFLPLLYTPPTNMPNPSHSFPLNFTFMMYLRCPVLIVEEHSIHPEVMVSPISSPLATQNQESLRSERAKARLREENERLLEQMGSGLS